MSKVAVVGFGRIGRSAVKAGLSAKLFTPSAIVDIVSADAMAPLFEFDTNYGRWRDPVSAEADGLVIGDATIAWIDARQSAPDWKALGIDVVLDCTGRATTRAGAQAHLDAGASRVLVSAPSKTLEDCDAVLLPGINQDSYDPARHRIVSMASCTTNALAPVVKVLRDTVGIRDGFFSTVHAYTNTQSLTDQPMKERRDSWAAAENIIPSSSGAAKALKFIWPDLQVTGKAYRVPGSHRQHRRADGPHQPADHCRRGQRGIRGRSRHRAAGRHSRRPARRLRIGADRRRDQVLDHRPAADLGERR